LGDIVACQPISKYYRKAYKDHAIFWVVDRKYADVIALNPYINKLIPISCLSEWIFLKKILKLEIIKNIKTIDLHFDSIECPRFGFVLSNKNASNVSFHNYFNGGNLLDAFTTVAGIPRLNELPFIYLDNRDIPAITLPDKFIVIHTQSNNEAKNWLVEKWLLLINDILRDFDFYILEVGLKSELGFNHPRFINLCGKLKLREIAYVIKRANFFIGIDSSFAHFANALSVPFVVAIGKYWNFEKYVPYSGEMSSNRIINHNGPVCEIKNETVYKEFASLVYENKEMN
jgi:heptosyltransferase-3